MNVTDLTQGLDRGPAGIWPMDGIVKVDRTGVNRMPAPD